MMGRSVLESEIYLEIGRQMLYASRRPNWRIFPIMLCVACGGVVM
jgi:hypothetical protein